MSRRILVVENNPENLELMRYLLHSFGHATLSAHNGEEGVAITSRERPRLVLCDINMPRLDGYGVVRALKSDPKLRRIPLMAVTALAMVGDRDKILAAGFDGYIGKPIDPTTFVPDIEMFLDQRRLHSSPLTARRGQHRA
jgi:CheY-like chemotaxis protein